MTRENWVTLEEILKDAREKLDGLMTDLMMTTILMQIAYGYCADRDADFCRVMDIVKEVTK